MRKRGRPRTEKPRYKHYGVRLNEEESEMLMKASDIIGISISDTIREGIKRIIDANSY